MTAAKKTRVATVLLAAGAGKRIGGPKALLAWPASGGGQPMPLSIAHAEARLAAESERVLVVTRAKVVASLLGYVRPGLDLLASDADDDLGAAGSLTFAVPRMGDADIVVVTPVDTPPAKAETVRALVAALEANPALLAVRPTYLGRGGHPVVLRPAALARYAEPAPPTLREHLRALGNACASVDVDDAAILLDLDTPADVQSALGAPPRFFK